MTVTEETCGQCGRAWIDHEFETDEGIVIGLWFPVPAYQPPHTYAICPFVEENQ